MWSFHDRESFQNLSEWPPVLIGTWLALTIGKQRKVSTKAYNMANMVSVSSVARLIWKQIGPFCNFELRGTGKRCGWNDVTSFFEVNPMTVYQVEELRDITWVLWMFWGAIKHLKRQLNAERLRSAIDLQKLPQEFEDQQRQKRKQMAADLQEAYSECV